MRTSNEIQAHIMLKAADDPEFRQRLISDPKGVIEAETGLELPADKLVFVHNAIEAASQPGLSGDVALTEAELAEVGGGECVTEWDGTVVCDT